MPTPFPAPLVLPPNLEGDVSPVQTEAAPVTRGRIRARWPSPKGLTLVEVMVALVLMATVMVGFIASFIQSRRVTESNVLHAAATSMIYGIIEQMKQLDYSTLLPNYEVDPFAPVATTPPYIRVRLNQSDRKSVV